MISAILVFNNTGKPRLLQFYENFDEEEQQKIVRTTFYQLSRREDQTSCSFVAAESTLGGPDYKLVYRQYATLYIVFCVDSSESELAMLDLIQVFVETLDKCFGVVRELDLIFNMDKVHLILNEMIMGGMVLETNMKEIVKRVEEQGIVEKHEVSTRPPVHVFGAMARRVNSTRQDFIGTRVPKLTKLFKEG